MGEVFVYRDGAVVPKYEAPPLRGVSVISDSMDAMRHPITQETTESKSRFRAITREHGCTEVGNEKFPERRTAPVSPVAPDIARAWDSLKKR